MRRHSTPVEMETTCVMALQTTSNRIYSKLFLSKQLRKRQSWPCELSHSQSTTRFLSPLLFGAIFCPFEQFWTIKMGECVGFYLNSILLAKYWSCRNLGRKFSFFFYLVRRSFFKPLHLDDECLKTGPRLAIGGQARKEKISCTALDVDATICMNTKRGRPWAVFFESVEQIKGNNLNKYYRGRRRNPYFCVWLGNLYRMFA